MAGPDVDRLFVEMHTQEAKIRGDAIARWASLHNS
jgi:hypothetical protein